MNQTRLGSLIEAVFNTAIGLGISLIANALVFPLFNFHPSLIQNVAISTIYTFISIARGYVIRRWFNARLQRAARLMAKTIAPPPAPPPVLTDQLPCQQCAAVLRVLKSSNEVTLRCPGCGIRYLHGRYVLQQPTVAGYQPRRVDGRIKAPPIKP